MPSYDIETNIIKETTNGSNLDGFNSISKTYSFIQFSPPPNKDIEFIQGDAVVYSPDSEVLSGLESGRTYYVDPVIPSANQSISKIALYQSSNQIGSASTVQIGIGSLSGHNFILERHANRKLETDKILRRIPLSQNLFVSSKHESPVKDIGILKDGVQIRSPISDKNIFYGPLESVDVLNSGRNFLPTQNLTADISSGNATYRVNTDPILFTVSEATDSSDVTGISTVTFNEFIPYPVFTNTDVKFVRLSRIITSSHSFEYIGAGTDINTSNPFQGGKPIPENEVVAINGGQIPFTSTDQKGNFRIGDGLTIDQTTSTIRGRDFNRAIQAQLTPLILALR